MNKKPLYLKQILNFINRRSSVINKKEIVNLLYAEDKILAENIYSKISLPPFKNSAVDGYALLKQDLNKINKKLTGNNALDESINQSWEQDNQAWWDWYVTLADNSYQANSDTSLDLPSFPNIALPSNKMIKNELSTPYNLKKKHINLLKINAF